MPWKQNPEWWQGTWTRARPGERSTGHPIQEQMSFKSFVNQFQRKPSVGGIVVAITPEGRAEVESHIAGGPEFDILARLNEQNSMPISKLAAATHLDIGKTRQVLRKLAQQGHVRRIEQIGEE